MFHRWAVSPELVRRTIPSPASRMNPPAPGGMGTWWTGLLLAAALVGGGELRSCAPSVADGLSVRISATGSGSAVKNLAMLLLACSEPPLTAVTRMPRMLEVEAEAAVLSALMKTPPTETDLPDPTGLNRVSQLFPSTTPGRFPVLKTYAGPNREIATTVHSPSCNESRRGASAHLTSGIRGPRTSMTAWFRQSPRQRGNAVPLP